MAPSREIEKLQRRWQENPSGLTFAPLAEAYRKEGMYLDALELLTIGLARHPNYVPAHIVRGRCYLDTGATADAEQAFLEVTHLDPENVIAYQHLADLAEEEGRYSEAMERLERLLELDPNNDEAQDQLARLRTRLAAQRSEAQSSPPASEPPMNAPAAETPLGAGGGQRAPDEEDRPVHAALFGVVRDQFLSEDEPTPEEGGTGDRERPNLATQADEASSPETALSAKVAPSTEAALSAQMAPSTEESPSADGASPAEAADAGAPSAEERPMADVVTAEVAGRGQEALESPAPIGEAASSAPTTPEPQEPGESRPNAASEWSPPPAAGVESPDRSGEIANLSAVGSEGGPVAGEAANLSAVGAEGGPVAGESGAPPSEIRSTEPAPTADEAPARVPEEERVVEEAPLQEVSAEAPGVEQRPAGTEAAAEEPPSDEPLEIETDLVVTESMAEIFVRQGHRELALAVYQQLLSRDPANSRVNAAIVQLSGELPKPPAGASPASYAAVMTGGQSVRAFFERLLAARRPGTVASGGPSVGAVVGEGGTATDAPEAGTTGPSYDEFYSDPPAPEVSSPARESATEDLESFTTWLKGLKR